MKMAKPATRNITFKSVALSMTNSEVRHRYHTQGVAAGGSALLDAINRGKVHLAKFILDAGEDDVVNTRDFKGKTPLIRACYIKVTPEETKTRDKAIELLISKGADVNIQDDIGRTALSYACELRCNDIVKILVQNNVDPDIFDEKGNTPLIYSALAGNDTAIEILIRSFRRLGLNVDHVNNDGLTALLIAAKNGFIECASILALEGRACISFRDREKGLNAEEWARTQGCSTPEVLPFSPQAALLSYRDLKLESSERRQARIDRIALEEESDDPVASELDSRQRAELDKICRRLSRIADEENAAAFDPALFRKMFSQPNAMPAGKRRSLPTMKFAAVNPSSQSEMTAPPDQMLHGKRSSVAVGMRGAMTHHERVRLGELQGNSKPLDESGGAISKGRPANADFSGQKLTPDRLVKDGAQRASTGVLDSSNAKPQTPTAGHRAGHLHATKDMIVEEDTDLKRDKTVEKQTHSQNHVSGKLKIGATASRSNKKDNNVLGGNDSTSTSHVILENKIGTS